MISAHNNLIDKPFGVTQGFKKPCLCSIYLVAGQGMGLVAGLSIESVGYVDF